MKESQEAEYDISRFRDICSITLENYIYMKKRLEFKDNFSKFILTYYSIFLIILGITGNYFKTFDKNLGDYVSILFSVVLLAYSLINSNAKYEVRIFNIEKSINLLKSLKRDEVVTLDKFKEKYDNIVNNTEMRSDRDFYNTVRSIYRKKNEGIAKFTFDLDVRDENKDIKKYRSDLNVFYHLLFNLFERVLIVIIVIAPVILLVFISCNK
ncbi:MAG: SLATT domain-containing protein [Cetobacterium sp.]